MRVRQNSASHSRTMLVPLPKATQMRIKSKIQSSLTPIRLRRLVADLPSAIPQKLKQQELASIIHSCLHAHEVTPLFRAKMVDWMLEVTSSFHCDTETFFLAVKLMDKFMKRRQVRFPLSDLHCLGVACMFIASKMQDVQPLVLEVVVQKISHCMLSRFQIREMELLIVDVLDFKLNLVTAYDALLNTGLYIPEETLRRAEIICRMCQYFIEFSEIRPSSVAFASLLMASQSTNQTTLGKLVREKLQGELISLDKLALSIHRLITPALEASKLRNITRFFDTSFLSAK